MNIVSNKQKIKDMIEKMEKEKELELKKNLSQNDAIKMLEQAKEEEKDKDVKKDISDIIAYIKAFFTNTNFMKQDLQRRLDNPNLLERARKIIENHPVLIKLAEKMLGKQYTDEIIRKYGLTKEAMQCKEQQNQWVKKL